MTKESQSLAARLEALVAPEVKRLGYDLIELEYLPKSQHGGPLLRLYIDHPNGQGISFSDCTTVDHGLDSLFESPAFDAIVPVAFTLEVSSPGVDRPLRNPSDFVKHSGNKVEVRTYRPLTAEEMGNPAYFTHHQKQKSFFGILRGYAGEAVEIEADKQLIRIPYALITKAHLDVSSQLPMEDAKKQ